MENGNDPTILLLLLYLTVPILEYLAKYADMTIGTRFIIHTPRQEYRRRHKWFQWEDRNTVSTTKLLEPNEYNS